MRQNPAQRLTAQRSAPTPPPPTASSAPSYTTETTTIIGTMRNDEHTQYAIADPPQPMRKHTVRITSFLKFLDANPGQWAIFKTYPKKGHIARHRVREYRRWYGARGYEFTHQSVGDVTTLYGKKVVAELVEDTRV